MPPSGHPRGGEQRGPSHGGQEVGAAEGARLQGPTAPSHWLDLARCDRATNQHTPIQGGRESPSRPLPPPRSLKKTG